MTIQEIEARRAEIAAEIETEGADLDALEKEVRELAEMEKEIRAKAEEEAEKRAAIAQGVVPVTVIETKDNTTEERKMDVKEIRNSDAYIDAFANYLKTGNDQECRALFTVNAATGGTIPVPEFVDEMIHTAWEKNDILSRVKKTYLRGNLKVAFEVSGDPAQIHEENGTDITEEQLVIGTVELLPKMLKKFITISDEVVALTGRSFIQYVYDELTYRITKLAADQVIAAIDALNTTASAAGPGSPVIFAEPGLTTIATAYAKLSDEATNPVIIMNKATYANFVEAQAAGNFAFDPFMGLPVLFNNTLPAFTGIEGNTTYAIVGDLAGAQVNYPEGDEVIIKYDDLSLAEKDLVKIVGRQYAAIGVVANNSFVRIKSENAG